MKKTLFALTLLTASTTSLSARELMCEQCEPQCIPECPEHLFVERSQIYVSAEFLYWTTVAPALDFALSSSNPFPDSGFLGTGDYKTADYSFCPGFRIGLAYYRCPRFWEVYGEYTWLKDEGKDSTSNFVRPTRFLSYNSPTTSAKSKIELDYQVGDLWASRVFDPNPHLRVRLIGGFTIANLEQDWKIQYTSIDGFTDEIKEDWCFFGGGIRAGIRADWFWGCQFYLTGKTTFAGMIGSWEHKEFQRELSTGAVFANAKYDDHRLAGHAQFLIGPSWQVPCDCWSFELLAAYEFNLWLNVHERIRTFATNPVSPTETLYANGLLGLHGLTLRLNIGF